MDLVSARYGDSYFVGLVINGDQVCHRGFHRFGFPVIDKVLVIRPGKDDFQRRDGIDQRSLLRQGIVGIAQADRCGRVFAGMNLIAAFHHNQALVAFHKFTGRCSDLLCLSVIHQVFIAGPDQVNNFACDDVFVFCCLKSCGLVCGFSCRQDVPGSVCAFQARCHCNVLAGVRCGAVFHGNRHHIAANQVGDRCCHLFLFTVIDHAFRFCPGKGDCPGSDGHGRAHIVAVGGLAVVLPLGAHHTVVDMFAGGQIRGQGKGFASTHHGGHGFVIPGVAQRILCVVSSHGAGRHHGVFHAAVFQTFRCGNRQRGRHSPVLLIQCSQFGGGKHFNLKRHAQFRGFLHHGALEMEDKVLIVGILFELVVNLVRDQVEALHGFTGIECLRHIADDGGCSFSGPHKRCLDQLALATQLRPVDHGIAVCFFSDVGHLQVVIEFAVGKGVRDLHDDFQIVRSVYRQTALCLKVAGDQPVELGKDAAEIGTDIVFAGLVAPQDPFHFRGGASLDVSKVHNLRVPLLQDGHAGVRIHEQFHLAVQEIEAGVGVVDDVQLYRVELLEDLGCHRHLQEHDDVIADHVGVYALFGNVEHGVAAVVEGHCGVFQVHFILHGMVAVRVVQIDVPGFRCLFNLVKGHAAGGEFTLHDVLFLDDEVQGRNGSVGHLHRLHFGQESVLQHAHLVEAFPGVLISACADEGHAAGGVCLQDFLVGFAQVEVYGRFTDGNAVGVHNSHVQHAGLIRVDHGDLTGHGGFLVQVVLRCDRQGQNFGLTVAGEHIDMGEGELSLCRCLLGAVAKVHSKGGDGTVIFGAGKVKHGFVARDHHAGHVDGNDRRMVDEVRVHRDGAALSAVSVYIIGFKVVFVHGIRIGDGFVRPGIVGPVAVSLYPCHALPCTGTLVPAVDDEAAGILDRLCAYVPGKVHLAGFRVVGARKALHFRCLQVNLQGGLYRLAPVAAAVHRGQFQFHDVAVSVGVSAFFTLELEGDLDGDIRAVRFFGVQPGLFDPAGCSLPAYLQQNAVHTVVVMYQDIEFVIVRSDGLTVGGCILPDCRQVGVQYQTDHGFVAAVLRGGCDSGFTQGLDGHKTGFGHFRDGSIRNAPGDVLIVCIIRQHHSRQLGRIAHLA